MQNDYSKYAGQDSGRSTARLRLSATIFEKLKWEAVQQI